jgi:hypothetical protein
MIPGNNDSLLEKVDDSNLRFFGLVFFTFKDQGQNDKPLD